MKLLATTIFAIIALSGCAAASSWVTANGTAIGQVALVAGAASAVESTAANAITLEKDLSAAEK